ncbi:hypothetical protein ACQY0O_004679 [Thecaphora frezii]
MKLFFLVLLLLPVIQAVHGLQRGLAWGVNNNFAKQKFGDLLTHYHHWADAAVPELDDQGMEFIPMLWGPQKISDWNKLKATFSKKQPKHILAMNEPDCAGQANMDPSSAAALWKKELQPLAQQGIKVSTPQLCWNLDWLKKFKEACDGCDIGFIAAHWYGAKGDFAKLQKYVDNVKAIYPGKELWITEMGLTAASGPSQSDINNFVQKAVTWMQTSGKVARVAWTGCFAVNSPPDGFLSNLGAFFNADGSVRSLLKWMANDQYPTGWTAEQWAEIGSSEQSASSSSSSINESKSTKSSSSSQETSSKSPDGSSSKSSSHESKSSSNESKSSDGSSSSSTESQTFSISGSSIKGVSGIDQSAAANSSSSNSSSGQKAKVIGAGKSHSKSGKKHRHKGAGKGRHGTCAAHRKSSA